MWVLYVAGLLSWNWLGLIIRLLMIKKQQHIYRYSKSSHSRINPLSLERTDKRRERCSLDRRDKSSVMWEEFVWWGLTPPLGWLAVQGDTSPCTVPYIRITLSRIKFEVEHELINILFLKTLGFQMWCVCLYFHHCVDQFWIESSLMGTVWLFLTVLRSCFRVGVTIWVTVRVGSGYGQG